MTAPLDYEIPELSGSDFFELMLRIEATWTRLITYVNIFL